MKRVYPVRDVCIGCRICELACITAHSDSKDLVIAMKQEKAAKGLAPCRLVYEKGPVCLAMSCRHCEEPSCVATCISGALYKDPASGKTLYDASKCVGCYSCLMACSYGAIRRHPTSKTIIKCDLCEGRDMPACVQACPNKALLFEERTADETA